MNHFVKKEVVASCLNRLRQRRTHEHFAGYLCLLYRAAEAGSADNLQPNFSDFFDDFFRVENCPETTPYIKPFINTAPSASNLWLNRNVAGSYAPSSIRSTFKRVVDVTDGRYSLYQNHVQMAFEHLLHGNPLNAFDLAVFLYRDFPLTVAPVTIEDIVSIFAVEFGYEAPDGVRDSAFNILFKVDPPENLNPDFLETV